MSLRIVRAVRARSIVLLLITACKPAAPATDAAIASSAPLAPMAAFTVPASDPLNLSFEFGDPPMGWSTDVDGEGPVSPPKDFTISLDRDVVRGGTRSLHLGGRRQEIGGSGVTLFRALPLDAVRGKSLRFSGWMRSRSSASLFLRVDGPDPGVTIYNVFPVDGGVDGEWQQYAVEHPIPADARRVVIGCSLHDNVGEAWFDGLELIAAGAPL